MLSTLLLALAMQTITAGTPPKAGGKITCTVGDRCRGSDAMSDWLAGVVNKEVAKPGSGLSEVFGEEEARVMLSCVATGDGGVRNCSVLEQTPAVGNAGEEALRKAPDLRIATTVKAGAKVRVPVIFRERLLAPTDVVYLRRPDARLFSSLYPDEARRKRLEGKGAVKCRVTETGMLGSCRVVEETPAGSGFGMATMALMSGVQIAPKTKSGQPTLDAKVVIPVTWKLGR